MALGAGSFSVDLDQRPTRVGTNLPPAVDPRAFRLLWRYHRDTFLQKGSIAKGQVTERVRNLSGADIVGCAGSRFAAMENVILPILPAAFPFATFPEAPLA